MIVLARVALLIETLDILHFIWFEFKFESTLSARRFLMTTSQLQHLKVVCSVLDSLQISHCLLSYGRLCCVFQVMHIEMCYFLRNSVEYFGCLECLLPSLHTNGKFADLVKIVFVSFENFE